MTKDNLEELLELAFEMEGLITLMLKREDMTPDNVKNLLQRKASKFSELLGVETAVENIPVHSIEPPVDFEERVVISTVEAIPEDTDKETVTESVVEDVVDEELPVEKVNEEEAVEEIADSALFEEEEDAQPESPGVSAPETEVDVPEKVIEEKEEITETTVSEVLNDVLSRKTPVFTLNDKFRFRRNLFNESDEEFAGTLRIISEMKSMEEVEDYLYNDLCFEPDNEDVKAFIDIISLQFA